MNTYIFDTLKYARKFEQAGFSREQAEMQTDIVKEMINDTMQNYAPKAEIAQFKSDFKHDLDILENRFENRIQKELAPIRTNIAVIMWTQGLIVIAVVIPAFKVILGL